MDLKDWNKQKYITAIEYAELPYIELQKSIVLNKLHSVVHSPAVYIICKEDNTIVHVGSTNDLHRRVYEHTRVGKKYLSCLNNTKTKLLNESILGDYKVFYIEESLNLDKDNLSNLEANIGYVFEPEFDTSYRIIDTKKFNKKVKIHFKNN